MIKTCSYDAVRSTKLQNETEKQYKKIQDNIMQKMCG